MKWSDVFNLKIWPIIICVKKLYVERILLLSFPQMNLNNKVCVWKKSQKKEEW